MLFESIYFRMSKKTFTPFFSMQEPFFLSFSLPPPAIFLTAVMPSSEFFHVSFAHLCAYGVQCLCIDIAACAGERLCCRQTFVHSILYARHPNAVAVAECRYEGVVVAFAYG